MAFTTRSKRDISALPVTETSGNVGPGTYIGHSQYYVKPNSAPFCSTKDRGITLESSRDFAPVASSASEDSLGLNCKVGRRPFSTNCPEGYHQPPRPSSSFAVGISRFDEGRMRSLTPGPGAYGQLSTRDWFKGPPRTKLEGRRRMVVFKRAVSAPSVPAKNQSFGYDEEESGELVMQVGRLVAES